MENTQPWYKRWIARLYDEEVIDESLPLFIYLLQTVYPELWAWCEHECATIAVPHPSTMGDMHEVADFESHVLKANEEEPGTYRTFNNKQCRIIGGEICTDIGFSEKRHIQLLGMESLREHCMSMANSDAPAPAEDQQLASSNGPNRLDSSKIAGYETIIIMHCARPLTGGLADAPDHFDELGPMAVERLTKVLRNFHELTSVFRSLDRLITELDCIGKQTEDELGGVKPSLSHYLQSQWHAAVQQICGRITSLGVTAGNAFTSYIWGTKSSRYRERIQTRGEAEMLYKSIPILIECYIMTHLHDSVHPWFQHQCSANEARMSNLLYRLRTFTQHDCGVQPDFQCNLDGAVKTLAKLAAVATPLEKLLVLKNTVRKVQSSVQRSLIRRVSSAEELPNLTTDDLVLLLVYVIIRCAPHASSLITEIHYIKAFRFVPISKNYLGYILSTFEVAASWFICKIPDFEEYDHLGFENLKIQSDAKEEFEAVPRDLLEILPHSITQDAYNRSIVPKSIEISRLVESREQERRNNIQDYCTSKQINSPKGIFAEHAFKHGLVHLTRLETSQPGDIGVCCSSSDDGFIPSNDYNDSELHSRSDLNALESNMDSVTMKNAVPVVDAICGQCCFAVVTSSGAILTWGIENNQHRLGQDIRTSEKLPYVSTPTRVKQLISLTVARVACGKDHMLALLSRGIVYSWGDNRWGQLGTSEKEISRAIPASVFISKDIQVVGIACGAQHSLAVTNDGIIYSWGCPRRGQLGRISEFDSSKGVHYLPGRVEVDWKVRSTFWTANHRKGDEIIDSNCGDRVEGRNHIDENSIEAISVAAGAEHSIVVTNEGVVFTFGCGQDGQLGHGNHADYFSPEHVSSLGGQFIVQAVGGAAHTLFRTKNGELYGCGCNSSGQVGVREDISEQVHGNRTYGDQNQLTTRAILVPLRILVSADMKIIDVSAGRNHSVATVSTNDETKDTVKLFSWGTNEGGRLGIGKSPSEVSFAMYPTEMAIAARGLSIAVAGPQADHTLIFEITPDARRIAQVRRCGGWGAL